MAKTVEGTVDEFQSKVQKIAAEPGPSIRPDVAALAASMTEQLETLNGLKIVKGG